MVPVKRFMSVKGIPLSDILTDDKIDKLVERTRHGGAEIVSLLKTASAYYAPAASSFEMVKAVLKDEKRMLPVSAYLDGEYEASDVYVGVPAVIGKDGAERIIDVKLDADESKSLRHSIDSVKSMISKLTI